jgi:putative acetyltransferase
MVLIREETAADHDAIRELNRIAFGGNEEADIVDRLRSAGLVVVSLVAVENNEIVGHIMFSELPIDTDQGVLIAASLAPMSVHPKCQRQGIGSALVGKGLKLCRNRGKSIVVVVGHPTYYPRFGFSAELAKNLHGPFSGDVWMALELKSRALENVSGTVRYPEAFGLSEH